MPQTNHRERFMDRFRRSVSLPAGVSPEGSKAVYKNGVPEVRMPKLKTAARKKIDVEFH